LQEADRLKARKPTKAHALEKKEAIMKVSQFVYSASAVKQMLQEKKMAAPRPANIALEKSRVLEALSDAVSRGDEAERERLESRLKELEVFATQVKTKDAKALALAEMNRRNRLLLHKPVCQIWFGDAQDGLFRHCEHYKPFSLVKSLVC